MKLKSIIHSLVVTFLLSSLFFGYSAYAADLSNSKARSDASNLHSLPIEVQDYLSKQNIIVNQTDPVGYFLIPTSDLEVIYDRNKVNLEQTGFAYNFSNKKFIKFFVFHIDESVMESLKNKYTYIDEKTTTYYVLKMNSKNQIIWKTNEDTIKPKLISTEITNPDISIKLIRGRNLGLNFGVKLID